MTPDERSIRFIGAPAEFPSLVDLLVSETRKIVDRSSNSDRVILERYGAYGIGSFTDMMGWALANARHELTRYTIMENLECEKREDHPGLLYDLLCQSKAAPTASAMRHMQPVMQKLRDAQRDRETIGLFGTMHFTMVENTSLVFVPDIGERARRRGATNLRYVDIHGEADVAHAHAFVRATLAEAGSGYSRQCYSQLARRAADLALEIMERIYL